jgi:hypothetical protein
MRAQLDELRAAAFGEPDSSGEAGDAASEVGLLSAALLPASFLAVS